MLKRFLTVQFVAFMFVITFTTFHVTLIVLPIVLLLTALVQFAMLSRKPVEPQPDFTCKSEEQL